MRPIGKQSPGIFKQIKTDASATAKDWGRVHRWWFQRLREIGASVTARDVLVVIASYADSKTGEAYPAITTIAKELGISERAVKGAVAELKGAGILKTMARNKRLRESNLYELSIFGTPFQVKGVLPLDNTRSSEVKASPGNADQVKLEGRLGEAGDVKQGQRLSANSASNRPENLIEPIAREHAPAGDREKEADRNRYERDLLRLMDVLIRAISSNGTGNANGQAKVTSKTEAVRLLVMFPSPLDRDRLLTHLESAFADPDPKRSVTARIAQACGMVEKGIAA